MSSTKTRPAWWEWLFLATLLVAFSWMTLAASPQKSASFDEQFHLTAGYAYWKTGDYRLATTHPPLAGLIASLPLLSDESIHLPLESQFWEQGNRWDFSDAFFWYTPNDVPWMLARARWSMVVLGLLLVATVWGWARMLFGWAGAAIAGLLAAFDPNLLANSRQVTTDIPLTLFLLLTLWLVWMWLERPRWWLILLAGLCAGLTVVAKYNGLLIAPLVLLTLLLYPLSANTAGDRPLLARLQGRLPGRLLALLAIGAVAAGVLWATYKFDFGPTTLFGVNLSLPAPFYWGHLTSTVDNLLTQTAVKPDFLLGDVGSGGWWYYFPVAIALKTPLPLLILFALGVITLLAGGGWRRQAALWLPVLFFLGIGLTGILTIGYRHILPILPMAAILAGNNARWLILSHQNTHQNTQQSARPILQAATGALLLWLVVATVRYFPNHDSYFNETAGPWQNWSNLLVDSNLDWGQDLPALATVMAQMGIERVNLAYFGRSAPEAYGVDYSPLPSFQRFLTGGREPNAWNPVAPEPGWYAISATALRLGTLTLNTTDLFGYFRHLAPIARAGYSIYLYYVPEDEPASRALFTGEPVWQRDANVLASPTGRVQTKWRADLQSRVLPLEGGAPPPLPDDVDLHPLDATLGTDAGTVFTLEGAAYEEVAPAGEPLDVTLYWRKGAALMPMPAPTLGEPVSAFIHLIPGIVAADATEAPGNVNVADGWSVALRGLEEGDLIEQKLTLNPSADLPAGAYTLLAGLYSPQNGERLQVTQAGVPAASRLASVLVGTLTIEE